jgi:5-(carboxyamino)imidazole ribonucleotide mutase
MQNSTIVSIVMGSDSDLKLCIEACHIFDEFDVSYEVKVISAHRNTEECIKFAKEAKERGIQVIIAAAGMSAHLAGVIAANTVLPVIGIPLCRTSLLGLDALFSTIQMPPGIPVATVGVDSSANAAFLALRILAPKDKNIEEKLIDYSEKMKKSLSEKQEKVEKSLNDSK